MKLSGSTYVFLAALGCAPALASPTTDYTRRNEALAPRGNTLPRPSRQPAEQRASVQEKRVTFATVDKETSALSGRRATIEVVETAPKNVRSPSSDLQRPAAQPPQLSPLNQRRAGVSTSDARTFPLVSKYQDRLAPGKTVSIGRTPSLTRGAEARLNRFVFRHNSPPPTAPATAVPAGADGDGSR